MKNILIVSLNSGGTMGHGKIITSLANFLSKNNKNVTILSDMPFSRNFEVDKRVKTKILKKVPHINYTLGGMCDCGQKEEIYNFALEENIECVILSTFFDLELVKNFMNKKVKTILLSYPIRDTYRLALKQRGAYNSFDRVITLYGPEFKDKAMLNEILANPLKIAKKEIKKSLKNDILITCGGGGRPSSKLFLRKVVSSLRKIIEKDKKIKITLIKGNSKQTISNKKIHTFTWKKNFSDYLSSSKVIISEAGYYTMLDLINYQKKAIFLPGERIIDNQEIRALRLEELGLGKTFFPFEKISSLSEIIKEYLNEKCIDRKKFKRILDLFRCHKDLEEVILKELR